MCRLYGFRANEPTKVECTLVRAQNALLIQSREDRRGRSNPDGWGIAIYENGAPHVKRSHTAAFEDLRFSATAERAFSETVVAHVREATVGRIDPANTHPFRHGPWVMAHNGTVSGFDRVESRLVEETDDDLLAERSGSTDSEMAFLWLMTRMRRSGLDLEHPATDRQLLGEVVAEGVRGLADRSEVLSVDSPERLNLLLTDGQVMVATCWNHSLFWVERPGVHDCEVCGIPHVHHRTGCAYRAVVIASEPLSHEDWRAVPNRALLFVDPEIRSTLVSL